jgi:hypothetical protein
MLGLKLLKLSELNIWTEFLSVIPAIDFASVTMAGYQLLRI